MSDWQSLGGVFTSPPDIVSFGPGNKLTFVFAVGTDQALWYREFDGISTWSPWQSLGGVVMSPPFAVRTGPSAVDVFAVGALSELLHWHFQDTQWTTEGESLGGILMSQPHAVLEGDPFGEFNVDVFALGTDHAVWIRVFSSDGSTGPWDTFLGAPRISKPHVVVQRRSGTHIFALGTDSAIWWWGWGNSSWVSLGGTFTSEPFAVAFSDSDHVHVFARGTNSDLQHRQSDDGKNWGNWESLGGILESPPTGVTRAGPGESVSIYTVGTDSAAWKISLVNGHASEWQSLGGVLIASPHAAFTETVVGLMADHTVAVRAG